MPRYAAMETRISSQLKFWQKEKEKIIAPEESRPLPFITISREYGCGGYEIADKITELLNNELNPEPHWAAYDRSLLDKLMNDMGLSQSLIETLTNNARKAMTNLLQASFSDLPPQVAVYRKLAETVRVLALNGNVIIVGRAGNVITRELENGYHVRIVADTKWKKERISQTMNITPKEAEKIIQEKSKERESFIKEFIRFDSSDPHNFDLFVNNTTHSTEEVSKLIIAGLKIKGFISS